MMAIMFFTGFRTMSQVFSRPASKRQVKETHFETDPETAVRWKIQEQHQDKKFVFYYDKTAVVVPFNSSMWVLGTTADSKLALKPGDQMRIIHKSKDPEAMFLGSGKSKDAHNHQKETQDRLYKGLEPLFLNNQSTAPPTEKQIKDETLRRGSTIVFESPLMNDEGTAKRNTPKKNKGKRDPPNPKQQMRETSSIASGSQGAPNLLLFEPKKTLKLQDKICDKASPLILIVCFSTRLWSLIFLEHEKWQKR